MKFFDPTGKYQVVNDFRGFRMPYRIYGKTEEANLRYRYEHLERYSIAPDFTVQGPTFGLQDIRE